MRQNVFMQGKIDRHREAIKKYQEYENGKLNKLKLTDMIKGQKTKPMIPKPGEFLCVASGKPIDQLGYLDIPLGELLDGTKTFTELKDQAFEKKNEKLKSSSLPRRNMKKSAILKQNKRQILNESIEDQLIIQEELGVDPQTKPEFTMNIRQIVNIQHKQLMSQTKDLIQDILLTRFTDNEQFIDRGDRKLPTIEVQRNIQSANSLRPIRPVSAKYLIKALKIEKDEPIEISKGIQATLANEKRARLQSAKPRNFYVPQLDDGPQIKHIMGYQTINLNSKDFNQAFDEEFKREKEKKELEKLFKTSAVDPRLQSPYLRTDHNASKKVLQAQEQRGELDLIKKRKEQFMAEPVNGNGRFLPLDYYYIEDQYGVDLIHKFRDENGKTYGFSKWFDTQGNFTWEECEVTGYIQAEDKFEIIWMKNKKSKIVTRVNLRFKCEDEIYYETQLQVAENYRKRSEIFIKYNYLIDQMDEETSLLSDDVLLRIQYQVGGCTFKLKPLRNPVEFSNMEPPIKFNFKRNLIPNVLLNYGKNILELFREHYFRLDQVNSLSQEVRKEFQRANRQIIFNQQLVFSQEKQKIFVGYLPDEMFLLPQDAKLIKPSAVFPKERGIGPDNFLELFKLMNRIIHQAVPEKLQTLQHTYDTLETFAKQNLFQVEFNAPIEIANMKRLMNYRCQDTIRDFKSRMYDTHFEVMSMVDEEIKNLKKIEEEKLRWVVREADRRLIQEQELQSETLTLLKGFQKLVSFKFERAGRDCWERSIISLNTLMERMLNQFYRINQIDESKNFTVEHVWKYAWDLEFTPFNNELLMKVEVIFEEKDNKTLLDPPAEQWQLLLQDAVSSALSGLTSIQTMRTREIGVAREDLMLHVFESINDPVVVLNKQKFNNLIKKCFSMLQLYQQKLSEFTTFHDYHPEKKLKKATFEEFSRELDKLKSCEDGLTKYMFKKQFRCGVFFLDCTQFLSKCQKQVKEATSSIYELLIQRIAKENMNIEGEILKTIQRLKYQPQTLEELNDLRIFARDDLPFLLREITAKINHVMEKMTLMERMHYKMTYENFSKSWSIYGMPLKLLRRQEKCLKGLQNLERKFQEDLQNQQGSLSGEIQYLSTELDVLMLEHDIQEIESISSKYTDLGERLDKATQEGEIVNRREGILKWKISDFNEIQKIKKAFAPYNKVWTLARDYNFKIPIALNGPLGQVDREQITNDVIEAWNELFKLEKTTFKIIPHMLLVTNYVRRLYEEFKPYLPIINDLRNPSLKKRHFKRLSELIGIEVDEELSIPFKQLRDSHGIMQYKEEIREIAEISDKEQGFERIMNKMKSEWRNIKFDLVEFRDTGAFILRGIEPILDKLDEDISKTMSILSSPFVKFLENEVNAWRTQLFRVQENTELWCKVQRSWQYLQPIFFSDDIIREMPKEGSKYQMVDKLWRGIMQTTQAVPIVMEACFQNRLKENFILMIDQLDQVTKGLNDFLNKKRGQFPRFYFLSNEELLQILAQAREPRAVQRHLQKCFEGIEEITFNESERPYIQEIQHEQIDGLPKPKPYRCGLTISQMISGEKEIINFLNPINPLDKEFQVRGVEEWLYEVQQMMKQTLKQLILQSLPLTKTLSLKELISKLPAQVLLTCYEIIFTDEATQAIQKQKQSNEFLEKFERQTNNQLLTTVKLLREPQWNRREIQTLGVLVVLQVKEKDISSELKQKEVDALESFDWISQMRYYLGKKDDVEVRMLHTFRTYGYEYLGNQSRLVITPLTDRCYRTLMSALHMSMGGAPEGPAGTGKTETTKDLAKAVAKHCVVFNCSDQLDYLAMGKFFKGLVSCGSWACFDEFNRIELEVLSVIAQQVLTIQTAVMRDSTSKVPVKSFQFEGSQVQLDPSCAVFITMNPGYAGRSELPDNLKALFRSVAMMIPNYAMITEISLYSYGFTKARSLSVKITTSLKLASEQLSTQSHYDFGMRAVKAIILAAGQLKRDSPVQEEDDEESEDLLILRAIEDCNLPKFTVKDVPLFQAILSDLFPKVQQKPRHYGALEQAIKEVIAQQNLQFSDRFFMKVIQLYETVNVRHGLMLVGGTISGKTSVLQTLSKSLPLQNIITKQKLILEDRQEKLLRLQEEQGEDFKPPEKEPLPEILPDAEWKVSTYLLNPKSITPRLLYGDVDEATNEWQDGITAVIFRECLEERSAGWRWVVFDGPVDALWIENMNTVLDDNKKLCLTNGETIRLSEWVRVIFEVEDLTEASPATVSRCGMVYMEPQEIGWQALFNPWFATLIQPLTSQEYQELFMTLYERYFEKALTFLNQVRLVHTYSNEWLGMSCLRLLNSFLLKNKTTKEIIQEIQRNNEKQAARIKALELEGNTQQLQQLKKQHALTDQRKTEIVAYFFMALVWSVGGLMEEDKRKHFSDFLKDEIKHLLDFNSIEILKGLGKDLYPPNDSTLYEIIYDVEKKNWQLWNSKIEYQIPKETQFHEIYVPTTDSQRSTGLVRLLLKHDYPVLLYGKTGTGKTMVVKRFLLNELDPNAFVPTITAFSANTSCLQVLDIVESRLEKQKRRKGVYGPLIGTINIIFVDDMNMPKKEKYGAQPPLELIRQWFSQGGWYDKRSLECKTIQDIIFCGAMGLGRPQISQRLIRHFNMIYLPETNEKTLKYIVQKVCDWGLDQYVDKVKQVAKSFPSLCYSVFMKTTKVFLPLPKKSHYLFNLRDLMKVVQGVLQVPAQKYEATGDIKQQILRLWVHESTRVYSDRLVDDVDKKLFMELMDEVLELEMGIKIEYEKFLYGNFMEPHSVMKQYQELNDRTKIQQVIEEYVTEFNDIYPRMRMQLVLFEDAIQFLCKMNRILSQPYGNALLVGLGGTGFRTLSRLSAFMQDYEVSEPDIDRDYTLLDWYDYLRELLKRVGLKNKFTTFLLSDAQIINEIFLQDVNNILNIGEIPNLYGPDDKEALLSDLKDETDRERLQLSSQQLWEYFIKKCRMNLHVVLYLSPVGDQLKQRIRNFPSVVSCTSIIWGEAWSQPALKEVALHFLQKGTSDILDENQINMVAQVCVGLHHSVQMETINYEAETGKHYYVTPPSYMRLLQCFTKVFEDKRQQVENKRDTYIAGVKMLDECAVIVGQMGIELEALQPILVQKTLETDEIMQKVVAQTTEAEKQRIIVQADEIETQKKANIAAQIQQKCKDRLSEAEPQLEEALNALKTLKVQDFVEMKSFQNPPKLIRLTMDAVCIMMERKPKKSSDGSDDYWDEAKKLLADPGKFIKTLEKYNRNNIPEKVIHKMTQFLNSNKQFQPQTIAKASQAAEGLCKWVIAIFNYHHVYKAIQPLREDLDKANESLKAAAEELKKKQTLLQEVEKICQDLKDKFNEANFSKQKLKAQITDCEIKMKRALDLTGGLSGEKVRWKETAEKLTNQVSGLLGDMLLSVGYLSYMGAFTSLYRTKILNTQWTPLVRSVKVPCSPEFQLINCLSSQIEVQEWVLNGLPLDDVSKENAIIMKNSESYPLIIDPQAQATKFIQRMERKQQAERNETLLVCKPDKRFPQLLEQALRFGHPLMVQGLDENLDSILDPILMKNIQVINNKRLISVGSNLIEFNPHFRLYLITSLSNPHYTPQVLTKVTLINFTITPEALRDQVTSILVREEEPQLEEEKIRIMNDNNFQMQKMQNLESSILEMLSKTDGARMLEDEKLVQQLSESKNTSEEINQRLKEAKLTEERIQINRQNYDLLSKFTSNFYFILVSMSKLETMYQFSLEFYVRIFRKAIKTADKPAVKNMRVRVNNITETLKRVLYTEVSRSIFVKHKSLYAFMLLISWLDSNGLISQNELQFLLTGLPLPDEQMAQHPNPDSSFFSETQWNTLIKLTSLERFRELTLQITQNLEAWKEYFKGNSDLPEPFNQLSGFSQLLLIRSVRKEYFGKAVQNLIAETLGPYFNQSLILPLQNSFQDSNISVPLIYILQPGDDPQEEVKKFAQDRGHILSFVSLGKGQGEQAQRAILEALGAGTWVILQNCHLAVSWLPQLEALLEQINVELEKKDKDRELKINTEFRLWLTTASTDKFPQQLLMDGVKMTKDPPCGVKANIMQIYKNQNSTKQERAFYQTCGSKTGEWKQLFLCLSYFHAIVRERRRYGPIGWNILYDFNDSDFRISVRQLKQMLSEYDQIPFKALIYLTGECYYGGKVTDDWDRRVLREQLSQFYKMEVFYDNYQFSVDEKYCVPEASQLEELDQVIEFIENIPDSTSPELFGLHSNAEITQAKLETENTILSLIQLGLVEGKGSTLGTDKNKIMCDRAQDLLNQIPQLFNIEDVRSKFKLDYYESMNTVLVQEVLRYNTLIEILYKSLRELIKAAQGLIVMTQELDKIGEAILNNVIPESWKNKSYPSLKPLLNYWKDLILRVEMFKSWIKYGAPKVFWVSGFYFTQSFFTGVLQNYARKKEIPIDQLKFKFQVMNETQQEMLEPQKIGVYIDGLYLEGASWNRELRILDEPIPNQIYENLPIVYMVPDQNEQIMNEEDTYICPVYKTTERKGTLSTTGHSTNFIIAITLPTNLNSSHWVKRGTALVSQLNE